MAVEPQQNLDQPKERGGGAGAGHHDKTHGNWVMTHPYYCEVDMWPPSRGNLCADIDVHFLNILFQSVYFGNRKTRVPIFFLDFVFVYLRSLFIINSSLFLRCSCFLHHYTSWLLHCVILGATVLFAPMSNVRIENDFGRKVAPGSVDSEEGLFSHCRVGKEDREREAGQASPEAFGCTHIYIHN